LLTKGRIFLLYGRVDVRSHNIALDNSEVNGFFEFSIID